MAAIITGSRWRRLRRIWRIAHAGRRAHRARDEEQRLLARQRMTELFAEAGGITMKIGQFMAEHDGSGVMGPLVSGIEPRPFAEMREVIEAELGQPADTIFAEIDEAGIAASLGQVHRAVLREGAEVAIKVRYPGIAEAVEDELRIVGMIPAIGPVRRWGLDLAGYRAVLQNNIARELDYRSEAIRQQRFVEELDVEGLVVPRLFMRFSGERLLVQSFEQGERLDQAVAWSRHDRLCLARTLLLTLFRSFFLLGEVHGDHHSGNLLYRRGDRPRVVLLDYGCTIPVSTRQRLALLRLIVDLRKRGVVDPLACFVAMGFDGAKLLQIAGEIPRLARILLQPFLGDAAFDPRSWNLGERFRSILGEQCWRFRSAAPAEFLLLLRSLQGLLLQLERLDVHLSWWPLLLEAVGLEIMTAAFNLELPQLRGSGGGHHPQRRDGAVRLRMEVERDGETVRSMSMPSAVALDLAAWVPAEVLQRLPANGNSSIAQIQRRVRESGLQPQQLIDLNLRAGRVRVWLE